MLIETLEAGRAVVVVGSGRRADVVVSGLGGVGKSQLAARHAWSVWSDTELDLAVWVSALSRDAVVTAYAEAAARVLIEQDPQIADRPPEDAARLFREWLATTSRRWLVVLDDVQDPADLRGLDPPPGAGGQVVLTSRRRDVGLGRGGHRVIELDVFAPDQALSYLTEALAGTTSSADREQWQRLAEELGWLPLALSQAAAYLADQPLLTVTAYRAMLADWRRTLTDLTPPEHTLPEHQATVAVTWSVSIDRADRIGDPARPRGAGLARRLLEIAALLDPNGIPHDVFTVQPMLDFLTTLAGRPVAPDDVYDGLTRLHRFNLITLILDRPARAVAVHALVQRAVRDTLTSGHLHHLAHTTANALLAAWPASEIFSRDLVQALRSTTTALHLHTIPALLTPTLHDVFDRVGGSLSFSGQIQAATTYWRTLHDHACTHLGLGHPVALTIRRQLAFLLNEAGDRVGAVAGLEALLADRLRVLGPEHPDTLPTRHGLARWRGEAGDTTSAIADYESLLAEVQLTTSHDFHALVVMRRGIIHWQHWRHGAHVGDPADAVAAFEVLLADLLQGSSPDELSTMHIRRELANWRGRAGDPARAVTELESLLAEVPHVQNPDNPIAFAIRRKLAGWRGEAGDRAGAVAGYEALLLDQLRDPGPDPDHPDILTTRHKLARWRGEAGDTAGAVAEFEAVLPDQLRVLGPDHPNTLNTRSNLDRWRNALEQEGVDTET
ncbi:tetratricopeptide repeat protein [Saccharothrix saharensis]|uniref:Tetratricopeptide repeat protein n=1 Tax=Saccharothrix saharensis TaxID=571190 RepID=A0A543J5Q9_9PSEU|nr:tetratricopeptide repeat protein [Saccharothrix saharensis]